MLCEFYEPQVSQFGGNDQKAAVPEPLTDEHREALATSSSRSAMAGLADVALAKFRSDFVQGRSRRRSGIWRNVCGTSHSVSADEAGCTLCSTLAASSLIHWRCLRRSTRDEPEQSAADFPKNLKLVMDVELNVSLRFGQRQLPLREVLELGAAP